MFFFLSKILYKILMPGSLVFLLLLSAVFFKKYRRKFSLAALLIFTVFSSPILCNEAFLLWEYPAKKISEMPVYDVGVVLSGFSVPEREPKDRTYFIRGADRLIHAVQLYKSGKLKKILLSGAPLFDAQGNILQKNNDLRETLLFCGVQEEDILTEEKSRNTFENAKFTAEILKKMPESDNILLITSSFHLRRASACFRGQGVVFDIFPTDFYAVEKSYGLRDLMPEEECFRNFSLLQHEIIGCVVYALMGYAEF